MKHHQFGAFGPLAALTLLTLSACGSSDTGPGGDGIASPYACVSAIKTVIDCKAAVEIVE